jgi:hypothetical protein
MPLGDDSRATHIEEFLRFDQELAPSGEQVPYVGRNGVTPNENGPAVGNLFASAAMSTG